MSQRSAPDGVDFYEVRETPARKEIVERGRAEAMRLLGNPTGRSALPHSVTCSSELIDGAGVKYDQFVVTLDSGARPSDADVDAIRRRLKPHSIETDTRGAVVQIRQDSYETRFLSLNMSRGQRWLHACAILLALALAAVAGLLLLRVEGRRQ